ncbi:transcription initiation factor TFIIH subunit 3 [Pseudohyphozyma bogoriensis]|nr:transcription initiation factor TFIIH subunit 3 [Pseudohyphozyma bogoriensis]
MAAESGDLLCLILDLNPLAWSLSGSPTDTGDFLTLESALDQILIFANAHLSLRHENHIAVWGAGYSSSRLLYSSQLSAAQSTATTSTSRDSNTYQQFSLADDRVAQGVKELISELPNEGSTSDSKAGLVAALAMALCHINRLSSSTDSLSSTLAKPKPRIAILSVTSDTSTQYVPIMNCIFSAQKVGIPIDVCKIYGPDAVFLQQACHLTSGSYYKIERRAGLLQYLIMAFLPACFCHRKIIDIGYVCSVCLSIFCSPLPVCSTCRTKFPMSTLKRLGFGARPPPANGGTPAGKAMAKKRKVVGGTPGADVKLSMLHFFGLEH